MKKTLEELVGEAINHAVENGIMSREAVEELVAKNDTAQAMQITALHQFKTGGKAAFLAFMEEYATPETAALATRLMA